MANGWVGKWWLAEFKELILPPALYVASSGYDLDFPEFWQIENDILSKDEWNLEQEKLYYKKIQLLICYIYLDPSFFNGLQAYSSYLVMVPRQMIRPCWSGIPILGHGLRYETIWNN